MPSPESLYAHSDHALQAIGAVGIHTDPLVLAERRGLAAVRSSGRVDAEGHGFWVCVTTYVHGSDDPLQGVAVEEIIVARAESYFRLGHDVGALSGTTRKAFTARIGLTAADLEQAVADHGDRLRAEAAQAAARGPVLTDEQRRFPWHALAMWSGPAS